MAPLTRDLDPDGPLTRDPDPDGPPHSRSRSGWPHSLARIRMASLTRIYMQNSVFRWYLYFISHELPTSYLLTAYYYCWINEECLAFRNFILLCISDCKCLRWTIMFWQNPVVTWTVVDPGKFDPDPYLTPEEKPGSDLNLTQTYLFYLDIEVNVIDI